MSLKIWATVFARLAAAVVLAAGAGLIFGAPPVWILATLGGYLAWHLYHALRLERYLNRKERPAPRDAAGTWGRIYAGLARRRRRDRLRKKRLTRLLKEFRKSTEAMPDAGVVLNPDHQITWLNAAATDLLGIRKSDRGQRIDNLLREPRLIRYLEEERLGQTLQMESPVDADRLLLLQLIPYGEDQKLLLGKDITREHRLEKVRRDFVANASHELRSPLTVIAGYLDSLADDPSVPEHWREPTGEMVAQAARMRAIIEDLLTLSRLEAAGSRATRGNVDVPGMLSLIRKDIAATKLRPAIVELHLETDAGLCGSEPELYSAFSNLVGNAVKYTGADGRVDIRWRLEAEGAALDVQDTGVGIPEEAIPRLTERFYRVQKGRERSSGGTGLGLAIVKHVMQRHDARLEVTSELGKGSTFTCHFPRSRLVTPARAPCCENATSESTSD
jgi:two-component system phosphate regulon sensor histidine kinase PhoR